MIRTIIIDDEEHGREGLKISIKKYCPEIDILHICESPEQGLAVITESKPDLVFLDVQMPNMSGFDLLQHISPVTFEAIFVTAHDQYAIKAIRFSGLEYLLKPIDIDDLIQAIRKVKERIGAEPDAFRYQSLLNNIQYKSREIERLAVPSREGIDLFETKEIIFCRANGISAELHLMGQRTKMVSKTLNDFESLLTEPGFCRVHQDVLVNMKHVQNYVKGEGDYALLNEGHRVAISQRRKDSFLLLLKKASVG
jgi:two-component system LytT family response regulator